MPRRAAITFDFHNTLVSCDSWFDLEVRTLPAKVVEHLPRRDVAGGPVPSASDLTATYRALRSEIVGHGVEMDALAGVLETLRRHALTVDPEGVAEAIDVLMRDCLDEAVAMPGAVQTVTELYGAGHRMGVVSSAVYHPFLEWALDRLGILSRFDVVVTSASAGFYKSRPEIYHRALADLDADASEACHVGDSVRWDHAMAKSIGMRTALISAEPHGLSRDQPLPDLHLPSLLGAAPLLDALAQGRAAHPPRA